MDAQTFLEAHWPEQGYYCVAIPISWTDEDTSEAKSAYKHFIYETIPEAVAQYELLRQAHDVYFAVNTLKERLKKKARVHENMAFSRNLFFDLDVGVAKPGKPAKFKTQQEALQSLDAFCATVGLPLPTLVSSGYGIHCYWRFEQDITVGQWLHYANLLRRLAIHHAFRCDPSCIHDQSRVLRVPGSFNFKDKANPKKVTVKHLSDAIDVEALWGILIDACEDAGISTDAAQRIVGKTVAGPAGGNMGGDDFSGRVPEYAQILATCAQVQFIEDNGGDLEYTHWHKSLGLIRRCSDGREHCHRLSMKNYDAYDEDEVDKKLDEQEAQGIGPTTCAVMNEVSGNDLCLSCPFWARCVSPINSPYTPRVIAAADLPKPLPQASGTPSYTYVPPPLPAGYQWAVVANNKAGSTTPVGVSIVTEKDERPVLIQFLDYHLYPVSRQMNYSGNGDQHIWCVHVPHEAPKTFVMPSSTINDAKELSKVLFEHGIYVDRNHFTMVQTYMSAYVKRLQRDSKPEMKYLHYGWVDANQGFIIGDHKLTKGGKTVPVQCSGGAADLLDTFSLKRSGTLELQVEAMKHFARQAKPSEQFYILCSLASPLIHMLDNYYGATINATGETGGGKTGLLFAAMSMWGNPRDCYMSGVKNEGATAKARTNGLFSMWSLPFALDEISGIEPEDARSLTYVATQSRGRIGATRDGGLQKRTGATVSSGDNEDFRANLLLTTSNGSLHSRLSEGSVVGAATSARVVEIDYPVLPPEVKIQGDEMLALILRNYGHIGEVFIQYVIDNYDSVKSQVREKAKEIDRVYGVKLAERFLSSVAPCVFVASVITRSLGLLDFDEVKIINWLMVEHLNRIRGVIAMEYTTPINALTDFIDESISQMVIADKFHGKVLEPHIPKYQAIKGRYERHECTMYISAEAFNTYLARKRLPRKEFMNTLTQMKVILGPARIQMARGTDFAGGPSQCFAVAMNHKDMNGSNEQLTAEADQRQLKIVASNVDPKPSDKPALSPSELKLLQPDGDDE